MLVEGIESQIERLVFTSIIVMYKSDEEIFNLHNAVREKSHEARGFVVLTLITNKRVIL